MAEVKRLPLLGTILEQNPMVTTRSPFISLPGKYKNSAVPLCVDRETLGRHTMLIGGTGSGKTNVFYYFVHQIKKQLRPDDLMIIFDTKGDYYRFYESKDRVIGGGMRFSPISEKWNIFKEIVADGWDEESIETNTHELSWTIFKKSIEKSKDPFFPNAARDLFAAILLCMIDKAKSDLNYKKKYLYNSELRNALNEATIFDIRELINSHPQYASVLSYIGDGTSDQALGVFAELKGTVRPLMVSAFAKQGMFSVRDFVRQCEGRTLFIEYDISTGETLTPVYSLLFDLAIKEALGRKKINGDVYLLCDEFRLLPYLQHIDNGVNFGRSMGLKIIAGLQSINQLTEAYGEYKGKNILAGFSSIYAFRANDMFTRDYIVGLHGKSVVLEQRRTIANSIVEDRQEAHVVEDWDMSDLEVGEAILSLPSGKPFKYKFDLYRGIY